MSSAVPIARARRPARPPASGARRAERRPESRRPARAPDPHRLVVAVARTFLEIEAGRRPFQQLAPLLSPALQVRLAPVARRRVGPGPAADAIVSVRITEPVPGRALDAAIVVRRGTRCGVLAIRVEREGPAWRIVELARPEDGARAMVTGPITHAAPLAALR